MKYRHALISALLLLGACSESTPYNPAGQPSPNLGAATNETIQGVLLDSVVSGVRYDAGNDVVGVTDINGSFEFFGGQPVHFYIGDLLLGTAYPIARPANLDNIDAPYIVTPIELAGTNATLNDIGTLNRVRLLLALDDDAIPENGITISAAVAAKASEISEITFTQNESVEQAIQFIRQGTGGSPTIPDANSARDHLCTSLKLKFCDQPDGPTDTEGTGGGENTSPVITGSPPSSITAGTEYEFVPTAYDANGDVLIFSVENAPSWLIFDRDSSSLKGLPQDSDVGNYSSIVISVSDGIHTVALDAFDLSVKRGNSAPFISGSPPLSITSGNSYYFLPTAADVDGDTLSFSISSKPAWAMFDTATGALSGTPEVSDTGVHPNIMLSVSDGKLKTALPPFGITVNLNNTAPIITGTPSTSVASGSNYSFIPQSSDADGDTLTFSIANKPAWASFSQTTGELIGSPGSTDTGTTESVTLSVTDGESTSVLPPFNITVNLTNTAPKISGTASNIVKADEPYLFTPSAYDADGNSLVFSVSGKPSWAGFNSSTGELSGTPASGDQGSYTGIVISVSDGTQLVSLPAFDITVGLTNLPLIITGIPDGTVAAGDAYQFSPTSNDGNGDTLVFNIINKPGWADFDEATGELNGLPSNNDARAYEDIRISVSDGAETATLAVFSITVTFTNQRPLIMGMPTLWVDSGDTYSFTPTASDSDGDTLFFSVTSLPRWASFDSGSGTISGTPTYQDARIWEGITITVADGLLSSFLAPFSITVNAVSNPPQISGTPGTTAVVGQAYEFSPTVSADNCDILSFDVTNLPAWASFNTDSGAITGTPTSSDIGTTTGITITVDAGDTQSSLNPFNLTVSGTNE